MLSNDTLNQILISSMSYMCLIVMYVQYCGMYGKVKVMKKWCYLGMCLLLVSCVSPLKHKQEISEVYIKDFQTEDAASCKPSDVDLNNHEAKQFFVKSKKVTYKVIHDHYNVAPCFIEGVLNKNGKVCQWKIQASAIGSITCDGDVTYYACDQCEALFD